MLHWKRGSQFSHWSTQETVLEIVEKFKCFVPFFAKTGLRLGLSPEQWALLIWDVFKAHMTQMVRDLLKARRIKVAYVPATYTSVFSPPDQFIQKEIKAGNNRQFCTWYANEINDQIDSGIPEDEVWVDFTLINMKPIHARWTINTFEALKDRKDLVRIAWEVTGLWAVIHRTFTPTPNFPVVYEDPGEQKGEHPNLSTLQLLALMKLNQHTVEVKLNRMKKPLKWKQKFKKKKLWHRSKWDAQEKANE